AGSFAPKTEFGIFLRNHVASTGLPSHSTHCCGRWGWDRLPAGTLKGSLRDLRGFGSCERQFRRREPKEPRPCQPFPSKRTGASRAQFPKREAPNLLHQGGKVPPVRRARKTAAARGIEACSTGHRRAAATQGR